MPLKSTWPPPCERKRPALDPRRVARTDALEGRAVGQVLAGMELVADVVARIVEGVAAAFPFSPKPIKPMSAANLASIRSAEPPFEVLPSQEPFSPDAQLHCYIHTPRLDRSPSHHRRTSPAPASLRPTVSSLGSFWTPAFQPSSLRIMRSRALAPHLLLLLLAQTLRPGFRPA